jgi:outer membrane lipoprotein-sorting protein
MVYQFKELTMPYQLMNEAFTITSGGRSSIQGVPVLILMLRDKEGPPMTLYIDMKNYRIIKDSGAFLMGGVETELSSEFHDFKKVDGRLLPFRIVNYAGGQKVGEIRIREYQVNPKLPDSLFVPGE